MCNDKMCNELKVGQLRKSGGGVVHEVVAIGRYMCLLSQPAGTAENAYSVERVLKWEVVTKYHDFKIDDPVIVVSQVVGGGIYKYRAHFAGVSLHGSPMVWPDGQTSHTSGTGIPLIVDEVHRV